MTERGTVRAAGCILAGSILGAASRHVEAFAGVLATRAAHLIRMYDEDTPADVEDMIDRIAAARGADPAAVRRALVGIRGENGYSPPPAAVLAFDRAEARGWPTDEDRVDGVLADMPVVIDGLDGDAIAYLRTAALDVLSRLNEPGDTSSTRGICERRAADDPHVEAPRLLTLVQHVIDRELGRVRG